MLDASCRHLGDPMSTPPQEQKGGSITLSVELLRGEEPGTYAVTLRAESGSGSIYTVSAAYAVFIAVDFEGEEPPEQFDDRLLATGSIMAYPYLRELISNLTARGRHGPLWLNPVDFGLLLRNRKGEVATSGTP